MAMLANEDQSVTTYINSQTEQPRTIKLPPGTYRVLDYATWEVREDIPPITLKEGEEKSAEVKLMTPERALTRVATVFVWSADGVLATDARPRVLDAAGKAIPSAHYFSDSSHRAYLLQPGHYKAMLERDGNAEAVTKEFDITAADGIVNVDLFLP